VKKLKKFKRFDKGGLTDSSGNPVLSGDGTPIGTGGKGAAAYIDSLENEDYSKQKEQGEKNLESIKDFFMGRRSKDEPSAPIEERKPPKAEEAKPAKAEPVKAEPAKTSPVKTPSVAQQMKDREKGGLNERANYAEGVLSKPGVAGYNYGPDNFEKEYLDKPNQDKFKFTGDAKKAEEYRQSLMPVNKPKPAAPKAVEKTPTPAAEKAKPSYVGAGDSDDSTETKKKNELERLKRVGSGAVEQTMMGPVETVAAGFTKIPSAIRAGVGLAKKAYNEFTKPAAKPAEKSEPKLDSKSEPKQGELFDAKGNPTAEATRVSPKRESRQGKLFDEEGNVTAEGARGGSKPAPKEAPKAEPKAETKSGAIQPTGKGPSEAGRKLMQEAGRGKPQTMREKAIEEVNASRAATKDPRGPVSDTKGAIKPTYKGPSQAGKEKMENAGKGAATGPQRSSLKDQAKEAINKQRAADKDSRGPLMEGSRPARPEPKPTKPTGAGPSEAGKKLMERTNNRSSTILEHERKPDLAMQEYISGRESARTRARDLPDDGLSTTRYANKKGGKIPAFKKGGLVGRADGCAIRGKTKGRMV
jgi:hypothetical protein